MFVLLENIRMALVGLRSNKLRSALTMLGITIGVAAVIVLISIGQAVDILVRSEFEGIGANLIFVIGADNGRGGFNRLIVAAAEAIADRYRVPDALLVMPQLNMGNRPVTFAGRQMDVRLQGVTTDYLRIRSREVIAGRFFDQAEIDSMARVAVIGQTAAERVFPDTFPVGQTVRIQGVNFQVIGVLNEVGGGGFGPDEDDLMVIPLTTAQTRLSGERVLAGDRPISGVLVQARDGNSVESVAQQIRQTLREEHNISFRDEDDFQIFTQADLLESFGNVTGLLTVFLGLIAGISLLVGGIGIMNIMLVTVTERTREIGLRKAVGAQRRDIMLQFLTEATVLALVGGALGILLAAGGTALFGALVPDLTTHVQPSSVILATAISACVGVFFGSYPAGRAAALHPIDALRYE